MKEIYHVSFPGLGIETEVSPVAFTIGTFSIYWYGIIIATGFVLAVTYCMKIAKKHNINEDKLLNCVIVGMITAVIGARTYFVAFSWDIYKNNPASILNIHSGGLAIYGGLLGALAGGLTAAKIQKMKIIPILDVAVFGFFIGQGIGRWGNFTNQEAFGSETSMPWAMVSEKTGGVGVHPCFFYESMWCLAGFLILHFVLSKRQCFNGELFYFYLIWYGAERTVVEGLRTDSLMIHGTNIRVSQVLSIILFISGLVLMITNLAKAKKKSKEMSPD